MDFRKKLKVRLNTAISYVLFGVVFLALSWWKNNDYLSSLGLVFIVMGLARIRQYRRISRSEDSIKEREIRETDERNVMLWTKAKSLAYTYCLMGLCCTTVIVQLMGYSEATRWLGLITFGCILIYWLCYWYIKRKY